MHVLMVAERIPPDIGGVERHIAGLSRELVGKGIDLTLVAPVADPRASFPDRRDGMKLMRIPRSKYSSRDYVAAWSWWWAHRSLLEEIDLIHFHDVYALIHWFGPAILMAPKKPRFLTFHGYEMRYPIPNRAKLYRYLAGKLVSASICVGHYLVKWFKIRTETITYGAVTQPEIKPIQGSGLGFEEWASIPSKPVATFIGRLASDTGLDIYIKGLGLLRREHDLDIRILICGDGPSRSSLDELSKREGVKARFIGAVSDPSPYIRHASLVFTSGYLSMLEAMICHRPVFTVFHTPIKSDYLSHFPDAEDLFSIASSPEKLAAEVLSFLSKLDEGARQVERAYNFAVQQTWSKLAEQYLALWTEN